MPIAPRTTVLSALLLLSLSSAAQQNPAPLSPFVKQDAPLLVLEHVRLIDGTGAAPQEDMRIDIAGGKITAVYAAKSRVAYPPNAKILDLTGKTVIPGLVGMHEHLFYPTGPGMYGNLAVSFTRLYLAGGVTTHGVALNVATDLRWFDRVTPCGIEGAGVASFETLGGGGHTPEEVAPALAGALASAFGCRVADAGPLDALIQSLAREATAA